MNAAAEKSSTTLDGCRMHCLAATCCAESALRLSSEQVPLNVRFVRSKQMRSLKVCKWIRRHF